MKLIELEPKFYSYEMRKTTIQVVDGEWDSKTNQYLVADGRSWREAGEPTKKVEQVGEFLTLVESFEEAQCIVFLCPKCFQTNGGRGGTHSCQMPFANRGVDPARHPNQWEARGSGFLDLTCTPSYLIKEGCGWHGYITDGYVSIT